MSQHAPLKLGGLAMAISSLVAAGNAWGPWSGASGVAADTLDERARTVLQGMEENHHLVLQGHRDVHAAYARGVVDGLAERGLHATDDLTGRISRLLDDQALEVSDMLRHMRMRGSLAGLTDDRWTTSRLESYVGWIEEIMPGVTDIVERTEEAFREAGIEHSAARLYALYLPASAIALGMPETRQAAWTIPDTHPDAGGVVDRLMGELRDWLMNSERISGIREDFLRDAGRRRVTEMMTPSADRTSLSMAQVDDDGMTP